MRLRTVVNSAGRAPILVLLGSALIAHGAGVVPERLVPPTKTIALDEHPVALPNDLQAPATVLILGFGRHSSDATTAWEHPVRTQLARPGKVGFFDLAMLAEVPAFIRPLVLRSIRHAVPDVLKPNFLPLTEQEDAWKQVAGYTPDQPEAAYVLVVDRTGRVRWSTHAPFSQTLFAELRQQTNALLPHLP